jgi:hypothetical protein
MQRDKALVSAIFQQQTPKIDLHYPVLYHWGRVQRDKALVSAKD